MSLKLFRSMQIYETLPNSAQNISMQYVISFYCGILNPSFSQCGCYLVVNIAMWVELTSINIIRKSLSQVNQRAKNMFYPLSSRIRSMGYTLFSWKHPRRATQKIFWVLLIWVRNLGICCWILFRVILQSHVSVQMMLYNRSLQSLIPGRIKASLVCTRGDTTGNPLLNTMQNQIQWLSVVNRYVLVMLGSLNLTIVNFWSALISGRYGNQSSCLLMNLISSLFWQHFESSYQNDLYISNYQMSICAIVSIILQHMHELRNALHQLVYGFPKQATATIDMLLNSDPNFFNNLTHLIIGKGEEQLHPQIIRGAIATLNTLALRCKSKKDIKDFLILQQIYRSLKIVLVDNKISFQNKKIMSPALSQFLSGACSTHKQILQLKQFLLKQNKYSVSIVLDTIVKSKQIQKPIKIECILQLFDVCLEETIKNFNILHQLQIDCENGSQQMFGIFLNRIKYFIGLANYIFTNIFHQISHPYQLEALGVISENKLFADILIYLVEWKHHYEQQLKFVWIKDIKSGKGDQIYEFYEINNLKQSVLQIISSIVSKTDPNFNLHQCVNKLMNRIPYLAINVLNELFRISNTFVSLNQEYLIGPLCDSMLQFIAQSLRLNDIVQMFVKNVQNRKLIECLLTYLRLRENDISNQDEQDFANFLQGFYGDINYATISRYGSSKLIQMCCKRFDTFSFIMFQTCYNNIVNQLNVRQTQSNRQESEDFYGHLLISSPDNPSSSTLINDAEISCCILGIISMEHHIEKRADFRQAISSLLVVLDIQHFQINQIAMIYYLLSKNQALFYDPNLVDASPRFIEWAFEISRNYKQCSTICLQFVKQLYLQIIVKLPIQHKLSLNICNIIANKIWEMISIYCQKQKQFNNQQFYDILFHIVNAQSIYQSGKAQPLNKSGKSNKTDKNKEQQDQDIFPSKGTQDNTKIRVRLQKVGDYLLAKYDGFLFVVMQKCCDKLAHQVVKQNHDKLLIIKIHHVIVECLSALDWLSKVQFKACQPKLMQFSQYIKPPSQMIKFVMSQTERDEYQGAVSIEQILNLIEVLAILINQQRKNTPFCKSSQSLIDCSLFEVLMPVMLKHPFGEPWLICICQFTHRISGKFQIDEIQLIMDMIKTSYDKHFNDQLKLNQLNLFVIVLLNYYQPENWNYIHEIVRLNMIKLIKMDSESDKTQRHKQMGRLGYNSEIIFGITIIRLFHVYLFGFRMQPSNQLLAQLLYSYQKYVQKYCLTEVSHLIIGFRSSYRQLNQQNFQKLLDILLQILNKLVLNSHFYGNQRLQQRKIRRLSHKIGCISIDPYRQFKQFILILHNEGINLLQHPKHSELIKSMMNTNTCMGQPRKIYSIKKKQ